MPFNNSEDMVPTPTLEKGTVTSFNMCYFIQRVIFNVVNFSKVKSLYRDGMSPMVKSTSRPVWQRTPAKNVFYYRCPDHKKNYVMSFAFAFDKEEVYQV